MDLDEGGGGQSMKIRKWATERHRLLLVSMCSRGTKDGLVLIP